MAISTAESVSPNGEIAGEILDTIVQEHGFYRAPNGSTTSFDPPGSTATVVYGINVDATIAGSYQDSAGVLHGYLRTVQ